MTHYGIFTYMAGGVMADFVVCDLNSDESAVKAPKENHRLLTGNFLEL